MVVLVTQTCPVLRVVSVISLSDSSGTIEVTVEVLVCFCLFSKTGEPTLYQQLKEIVTGKIATLLNLLLAAFY